MDKYINCANTFITSLRYFLEGQFRQRHDNLRVNLVNIVTWLIKNTTQVYFDNDSYFVHSDKDKVTLVPKFTLDDLIEYFVKPDNKFVVENFPTKDILKIVFPILTANKYYIKHDYQLPITNKEGNVVGCRTDAQLSLDNPSINDKIIYKFNIKSIIEFGIIWTQMRKTINEVITEAYASHENLMMDLIDNHIAIEQNISMSMQAVNDDEFKVPENYKPFALKGGNVFKLNKRNKIFEDINGKKKPIFKNDNLSDWDFTVSLPYHGYIDDYKKLFNSKNISDTININQQRIRYHSEIYKKQFEMLWLLLKGQLIQLRETFDANRLTQINQIIQNKIECLFDNKHIYNIIIEPANNISDTSLGYNNNQTNIRDDDLYYERNISNFRELLRKKPYNIKTNKNGSNKNLRILDMEVYTMINTPNKIYKDETINGFDLIRLALCYNISFSFGDVIDDNIELPINLSSIVTVELLDYACSKPFTIGSYLHGDDNDFEISIYRKLYNNNVIATNINDIRNVHSYKLYWFIKDIIYIIKMVDKQPKHEKRLIRIAETLKILVQTDPRGLSQFLNQKSIFDKNTKTFREVLLEIFTDGQNIVIEPNSILSLPNSIPRQLINQVVELLKGTW